MQVHNYDANIDVNNVRVQREFSLLATFKKVFRMIARLQGLHDDHFALLFEDDIAAHTVFGGQVRAQRKAQREDMTGVLPRSVFVSKPMAPKP